MCIKKWAILELPISSLHVIIFTHLPIFYAFYISQLKMGLPNKFWLKDSSFLSQKPYEMSRSESVEEWYRIFLSLNFAYDLRNSNKIDMIITLHRHHNHIHK